MTDRNKIQIESKNTDRESVHLLGNTEHERMAISARAVPRTLHRYSCEIPASKYRGTFYTHMGRIVANALYNSLWRPAGRPHPLVRELSRVCGPRRGGVLKDARDRIFKVSNPPPKSKCQARRFPKHGLSDNFSWDTILPYNLFHAKTSVLTCRLSIFSPKILIFIKVLTSCCTWVKRLLLYKSAHMISKCTSIPCRFSSQWGNARTRIVSFVALKTVS